jgi:hypothetical protein
MESSFCTSLGGECKQVSAVSRPGMGGGAGGAMDGRTDGWRRLERTTTAGLFKSCIDRSAAAALRTNSRLLRMRVSFITRLPLNLA